MKTFEGKEFAINDVVFYQKQKFDLLLVVSEEEKLSLGKVWNTSENENKIISGMKKIIDVKENKDGKLEVKYYDGTIVIYEPKYLDDIKILWEKQIRTEINEKARMRRR